MTASYLVAIAVTDPSSGRVWTAPTGPLALRFAGDCGAFGELIYSLGR